MHTGRYFWNWKWICQGGLRPLECSQQNFIKLSMCVQRTWHCKAAPSLSAVCGHCVPASRLADMHTCCGRVPRCQPYLLLPLKTSFDHTPHYRWSAQWPCTTWQSFHLLTLCPADWTQPCWPETNEILSAEPEPRKSLQAVSSWLMQGEREEG